jgi:uncharacterized protein (DUF433 family)
MPDPSPYVHTDAHGVMRVGRTRVMLDGIIAAWEQGDSPESIRSQYPALTLEEVYGAVAWCLAHPDEVDAYRKRQQAIWAQARAGAEANLPPVVRRLREERAARARGA